MARQTLIEIVQDLLSDMDSDEVNSISDTIEAEQVARVVRRAFYDILEEMDLPSKGDLLKLESASSADFPTRLKIPNATSRIDWIKYAEIGEDSEKIYHNVTYKSPADFISLVAARDPTGDDVQVVTYSTGIELPIQNDKFPTYWTSFDDDYIWFDSKRST